MSLTTPKRDPSLQHRNAACASPLTGTPCAFTFSFDITFGHFEISWSTQSHGLEFYVECQILSLTTKSVWQLFRYISWLDTSLQIPIQYKGNRNFRYRYVILFHTPIIAFGTVLGFHWKKNQSSVKWGLWLRDWLQFLHYVPLVTAESFTLCFVPCPNPVWFLWTLHCTLRLSCSSVISLPMPSTPSPQILPNVHRALPLRYDVSFFC